MAKEKLYDIQPKFIRDTLNQSVELTLQYAKAESNLVKSLIFIDYHRFYVRYGFKSLKGFCIHGLRLGKTQSQRIVTLVRRQKPTAQNLQIDEIYTQQISMADPMYSFSNNNNKS